MLMTEEMFLVSCVFALPVFWTLLKMSVNHSDQHPHQPTPRPALSSEKKQPFDKAA